MRIQPRQQLLDIWRATARASYPNGAWVWGGRDKANSISDAEQLLCILYPNSEVPTFKVDVPNEASEDVLESLAALGSGIEIPQVLIRAFGEYLSTYRTADGTPVFSGDTYFSSLEPDTDLTPDQRALDVVDSYSMSVTLCLAGLGFLKVFREQVRREALKREVDELSAAASDRLTAAMIGLLRSFSVNVFMPNSLQGRVLTRTINQAGQSDRQAVHDLQRALASVRAGLREFTIGSGQAEQLEDESTLFECGWTWGVVADAPEIEISEAPGAQPKGYARIGPYLYFTVVALDGIADLFSERTRVLGLLNPLQQRLASALQLRWDLTQRFWSTIATFGGGKWPLEDIPWRTADGQESDYFSLLVTAIAVPELIRRRAPDADLSRVVRVLDDLAGRSRVTRRPLATDPAIEMHSPGLKLTLTGSEQLGPGMSWLITDFPALLLKRAVGLSGLARSTELRDYVVGIADSVWQHLLARRMRSGPGMGLWDQARQAFPDVDLHHELPSWYFTERVVECLVQTSNVLSAPPLRSNRLIEIALDVLNEADHLYDREMLNGSPETPQLRTDLKRLDSTLARARSVVHERPASAIALANTVLRELDLLIAARQDAAES
ncbi:MAG: hypothetical protein V7637_1349 [Mycobacteriales bacterium]